MPETPQVNKDSLTLVLTELQRQHDAHLESNEALDGKATNLLEWSSLALAVVAAISTPELANADKIIPSVVVFMSLVLYIVIVVISLKAISPKLYELPIGIDWNEICNLYLAQDEQNTLLQLLSQYFSAIENNRAVAASKDRLLTWGFRLFPLLILVLAATATSSLWSGYFR